MSELIDNRAHRIRTLKEVIRHLHEGKAPLLGVAIVCMAVGPYL